MVNDLEVIEINFRPKRQVIFRRRLNPYSYHPYSYPIQPLLGPTGLIYYLRFRYSSSKETK